eukprot:scaffold28078_cov57-Phaeocystis_antarctica.AAC.8
MFKFVCSPPACSTTLEPRRVVGLRTEIAAVPARQERPARKASLVQPGDVVDPIAARLLSRVDELGLRERTHQRRVQVGPGCIAHDRAVRNGALKDLDRGVRRALLPRSSVPDGAVIEPLEAVDLEGNIATRPEVAPAGLA